VECIHLAQETIGFRKMLKILAKQISALQGGLCPMKLDNRGSKKRASFSKVIVWRI
jgi:hypothetical protein